MRKTADNVYYTILDYCYLARHMNIESKNINTVILNVETLLTEMKALRFKRGFVLPAGF